MLQRRLQSYGFFKDGEPEEQAFCDIMAMLFLYEPSSFLSE
ncbi:hypothetical protein T4A_10078 [Trichinella pseudospiralis]|uniref:Uncharacterized protein n=1 Tax=Trichinella pseudospiralis TaxID=6337 RepID=A0A0V1E7S1_TRIPS|nr:hypothetical protein T4A_10078 [Trichinella pseudospiralis]KRY85439.1 hypothetical protein T4D_7601 [Trichinella pseudospiralis]KRZ36768.1 hypothetical protein T4C_4108 [Trichinella pseudospiralis]